MLQSRRMNELEDQDQAVVEDELEKLVGELPPEPKPNLLPRWAEGSFGQYLVGQMGEPKDISHGMRYAKRVC